LATITATCKVGDLTIQIQGENQRELIEGIAFWSQLPTTCPMCGASVYLFHRQPQGYDYYGLKCVGEAGDGVNAHECNFGIYREGDGSLFYKADSWQDAWVPQGGGYSDDGSNPGYQDEEAPRERRQPQQGHQQGFHGQRSGQPAGNAVQPHPNPADTEGKPVMVCSQPSCRKPLNKGQHDVSMRAFGQPFCPSCQRQMVRQV